MDHMRAMQQPAQKAAVTSAAPMAVDETSQLAQILDQLKSLQLHNNTMSTELKQLKSQINSSKKETHPAPRGRPKNGSGSGSDITKPEKNHGAVPQEGYHSKKRSKSTDSKRSNQSSKSKKGGGQHQNTSHPNEQSRGKEQPREKSAAKPSTKKK